MKNFLNKIGRSFLNPIKDFLYPIFMWAFIIFILIPLFIIDLIIKFIYDSDSKGIFDYTRIDDDDLHGL